MFWRRLVLCLGNKALFDLAMIAAPRLRIRGFFFFFFRLFVSPQGGGRDGEIDENRNRQPSRLMEMGSNALDRDKRNVELEGEGGGG